MRSETRSENAGPPTVDPQSQRHQMCNESVTECAGKAQPFHQSMRSGMRDESAANAQHIRQEKCRRSALHPQWNPQRKRRHCVTPSATQTVEAAQ